MENNTTNIDAILAKFGLQKIKAEVSLETLTAENESLKNELEKLRTESELEKSNFIQASKEISETTEKEVSEIKAKYEFLQTENESIKAEIEKYKAGGVDLGIKDPNPDGNAKDDESTKVLKDIFASISPQQKALYGNG